MRDRRLDSRWTVAANLGASVAGRLRCIPAGHGPNPGSLGVWSTDSRASCNSGATQWPLSSRPQGASGGDGALLHSHSRQSSWSASGFWPEHQGILHLFVQEQRDARSRSGLTIAPRVATRPETAKCEEPGKPPPRSRGTRRRPRGGDPSTGAWELAAGNPAQTCIRRHRNTELQYLTPNGIRGIAFPWLIVALCATRRNASRVTSWGAKVGWPL